MLAIALAPAPGWAENHFNPAAFLPDDSPSAVMTLSTFFPYARAAGCIALTFTQTIRFATRDIDLPCGEDDGEKARPPMTAGLRACLTPEMLKIWE